jgi:hypothetical protein
MIKKSFLKTMTIPESNKNYKFSFENGLAIWSETHKINEVKDLTARFS